MKSVHPLFPASYASPLRLAGGITVLVLSAHSTPALSAGITEALTEGTPTLDVRYRYEFVDQDNPLDEAHASTVRTRLGYKTGQYQGIEAFIEAENVTAVGPENYNSTINGVTDHSVVADPTETEVNQAYLIYKGVPDTTLTYGRQRLFLDNHRFIGTVGWRQNEQTFDGFTLVNGSLADTKITAGYLYNANRIFSDAHPAGNFGLRAPVLNVQYKGLGVGALTGYGYLLDFTDLPAASTQTLGLRFSGDTAIGEGLKALYTLEYARQSDYEDNPQSFDVNYWLAEAGLAVSGITVKVGMESLGSDDGVAFQTPLATLHAMNGWTDQFLVTPVDGLEDLFFSAATSVGGLKLLAVYRDFSSEQNSIDYGSEVGLQALYPISANYSVGLKLASYSADDHSVDTDKAWLWGQVKF